jgi:hypothetical protein
MLTSFCEAPEEPAASLSENVPQFDPYSYFDRDGAIQISDAFSIRIRTILVCINILIVLAGVLIASIGLVVFKDGGYPIIGAAFFAVMIVGAWLQNRTFDYRRVYGVWRGLCPSCDEVLDINAKKDEEKIVFCPACNCRVMLKNRSFSAAPWYLS